MNHYMVKGINNNRTFLCAVVEGHSIQEVYTELLECMGIEALTYKEYVEALQLIGFTVVTDTEEIRRVTPCDVIEIPINLSKDDILF